MKDLAEKIETRINDFKSEMAKSIEGNKAAGTRARKITLELEKLFKEYRKMSIEAAKK